MLHRRKSTRKRLSDSRRSRNNFHIQNCSNSGNSTVSALSGPSQAPVVAQRRARSQPPKNCTCGVYTDFCTVWHCAYLSLRHDKNVQHEVDELNQKDHHFHVHLELLELELHEHRDFVSARPAHIAVSAHHKTSRGAIPAKPVHCITVLLVHTSHDAEHLKPDDNRREHSGRCIKMPGSSGLPTGQQEEDSGQPRNRPWLPPNAPLAPSGRQGAHQLSSPSSVPVGRRASCLATHPSESCGEWPRRAP